MNLTNLFTILRRELAAYFNSSLAYIFIIVFVLLNGGLYMSQFFLLGRADMRPFFAVLPFLLAVFLPAVTMRLWAEEKRGNTLELLLTFPMKTQELVLGKFLASFMIYLAALSATLSIPVMLIFLGSPDKGALFSGYLGAALLGAFFLSLGIFISGLCRDQIVAFILAMMVCFSLYLIGTAFMATTIDGWLPGMGTLLRRFVGIGHHFDTFPKGVVDSRDCLYFLLGVVIFLVLNGFWLEGRMRPKAKTVFTTAALVSAGIFLMGNWFLSGIPLGRFDLSAGQIYTVSPATKKILRELKTPVTVKFYISPAEKLPTGMKTLEQDITGKLDEFRIASKGKLQYKIFHMEAANVVQKETKEKKDSLEEQISKKGIEPFQVQSIEADEVGVRLIYSSISISYKEKPEEIIPRVGPDSLNELEYLIISKIYRMTLPETPKIAMVAPYEEKTMDPQMAALMAQLTGGNVPGNFREDKYEFLPLALEYEGYEISRIRLTKEELIPAGTKTLVIAEPENMNDRQRFEINRFLTGGGSVFMAVQNVEYEYAPEGRRLRVIPHEKKPEVNPLLAPWGIEVNDNMLVDAQHEVITISAGESLGPFETNLPVKLPIQIIVTPSGMNENVSVTSRLASIFYLWGSALKLDPEKIKAHNLQFTPLLKSSRDSWIVPFKAEALNPEDFVPQEGAERGPFPLAVMMQGKFPQEYSGKEIPAWPEDAQEKTPEAAKKDAPAGEPYIPVTPVPGKLILIGAATPFQKHLARAGGHLHFFLNAIDVLTLGDELVTIRSKRPIDRSIGRVPTATKVFWRFFVTLFVPIGIAGIGTLRVFLRRRSKQHYLKALAAA